MVLQVKPLPVISVSGMMPLGVLTIPLPMPLPANVPGKVEVHRLLALAWETWMEFHDPGSA